MFPFCIFKNCVYDAIDYRILGKRLQMRFFHSWQNVPAEYQNAVVAIGNFDGYHKGHQRIVEEAVKIAKETNRPAVLMTFEPHPNAFFRPSAHSAFRLTPVRTKVRAISRLPMSAFFVFAFNAPFANMSAKDFVQNVLIDGLHASRIVVGDDYGFGKNREGDIEFLRKNFPNLPVTAVTKLRDEHDEIISSSRIRSFIRDGRVDVAAKLMGRPFEIEGRVIHGFKRGRTLGFPTINIDPKDSITPKNGVYAAQVEIDGVFHNAVANIGTRPTVNGEGVLLEAHIIGYDGNLYARRLRVRLIRFIRPERHFSSLEELKQNISSDTQEAQRILQK